MDEQLMDELFKRLEPLAQKLGQGAEFLWEASMKQVLISGARGVLLTVVLTTMLLVIGHKTYRACDKNLQEGRANDRYYNEDFDLGWKWASIIGAYLLSTTLVLTVGLSSLNRLLNPGYYAIRSMLEAVGI